MSNHDFFTDRETHSHTGVDIAIVQPLKHHEYLLVVGRLHTDSIVLDREYPFPPPLLGTYLYAWRSIVSAKFDRIADKVLKELDQLDVVTEYLEITGQAELDPKGFIVSNEIEPPDPSKFVALENDPDALERLRFPGLDDDL